MQRLAPAGEPVEDEAGEERQPYPHLVWQRQRDEPAAALGDAVCCRELSLVVVHPGRRHSEHVPVDRAVGPGGHAREQVDVVVAEAVDAAGVDELQRRPRMLPRRRRERDELSRRGGARRHRPAGGVVVGRRLRR